MKLKEYFPKVRDMKGPQHEESEDDTKDSIREELDDSEEIKEPAGIESDPDDLPDPGQDSEISQPPQTHAVMSDNQPSVEQPPEAKEEKNEETEAQEEMMSESQPQSQIMESQETATPNSPVEPDRICESQEQNSITSEPAGCEISATDVEMNSQSTEIPSDSSQRGELDEEKDRK